MYLAAVALPRIKVVAAAWCFSPAAFSWLTALQNLLHQKCNLFWS
jgi:hypothetical protein